MLPDPTANPGAPAQAYRRTDRTASHALPVHAPAGSLVWYLGAQVPHPDTPAAQLGATKVEGYDPEDNHTRLVKLAQGTYVADEVKVGEILLKLGVKEMDALNDYFMAKSGKSLAGWLDGVTIGDAERVLEGLALGPLAYDVHLLNKSLAGIGTDEMLLTELVLNRSQEELKMLIAAYKKRFGRNLVDAVKSDLSGGLKKMFVMALDAQRTPDNVPVDPTQVQTDVEALVTAAKKKDEMPFIEIFVNRSHPHLAAVITAYGQRHTSLSKVIKKSFHSIFGHGDLKRSLLYILHGVKPKRGGQGIWRDAKLLEATMAGFGTSNGTLIYRTVRAHWNPQRFEAIKTAYKKRYGRTLEQRIKGDTSGDYRKVMIMVVKSTEGK